MVQIRFWSAAHSVNAKVAEAAKTGGELAIEGVNGIRTLHPMANVQLHIGGEKFQAMVALTVSITDDVLLGTELSSFERLMREVMDAKPAEILAVQTQQQYQAEKDSRKMTTKSPETGVNATAVDELIGLDYDVLHAPSPKHRLTRAQKQQTPEQQLQHWCWRIQTMMSSH